MDDIKDDITILGDVVLRDLHVLGAAYTDKATVERVQRAIVALPKDKQDPDFQSLAQALAKQKNAYGIYGPSTRVAVYKFNKLYGWPDDGEKITDGTLEALKRPDLVSASVAQVVERAAAAKTPAEVQAAAQAAQAAASQAQAQAVTPELKQAAAQAQAQAASAKTPAEVQAAAASVEDVTRQVAVSRSSFVDMMTERYAGIPAWGWGLGGAAVASGLVVLLVKLLRKKTV